MHGRTLFQTSGVPRNGKRSKVVATLYHPGDGHPLQISLREFRQYLTREDRESGIEDVEEARWRPEEGRGVTFPASRLPDVVSLLMEVQGWMEGAENEEG